MTLKSAYKSRLDNLLDLRSQHHDMTQYAAGEDCTFTLQSSMHNPSRSHLDRQITGDCVEELFREGISSRLRELSSLIMRNKDLSVEDKRELIGHKFESTQYHEMPEKYWEDVCYQYGIGQPKVEFQAIIVCDQTIIHAKLNGRACDVSKETEELWVKHMEGYGDGVYNFVLGDDMVLTTEPTKFKLVM